MSATAPKTVILAGGVGGARLAEGFAQCLPPERLTVIGNIGDDQAFYGLKVCPDLDTLLYTLSGRVARNQGWGVASDTGAVQAALAGFGAPVWMKLGDADLALHIFRSWRLSQGARLTEVTAEVARRMGLRLTLLPASDDAVPTEVFTGIPEEEGGWQAFQDWFVRDRCGPAVSKLRYRGAVRARPTPEVLRAIAEAELIVFAPSNPLLSIAPMLALPGLHDAIRHSGARKLAVSPLIGGKAVKGPLDKLLRDLGQPAGLDYIAGFYAGLADALAIHDSDAAGAATVQAHGLAPLVTDILIPNPTEARRLAETLLRSLDAQRAAGSDASTTAATPADLRSSRLQVAGSAA